MIFLNPGNPRFRQPCHFSGMRNCRVATAIAAAPQKGWFTTPLRLYAFTLATRMLALAS